MAVPVGSLRYARLAQRPGAAPLVALLTLGMSAFLHAQNAPGQHPRQFPPGTVRSIEDLPAGKLRSRLERLPAGPRRRALQHLKSFHFTELDLNSLAADEEGALFYIDHFAPEPALAAAESVIADAAAALPVSPFPASLVLHSRPGAPNVLYLNFTGESVRDTAWNTSLGRAVIAAVAFNTDGDSLTFSDSEQTAIRRIWQRVEEDYAPFDVDVTTERPALFGTRTAEALITSSTDATGAANPAANAGGVAYMDCFATFTYARYRPAWIYVDNLAGNESYVAEAVSHELGHNMGLSHDGQTDGTEYYGGHGNGETSWGPIMGGAYSRNVTQWSKGDYYLANNTQDDLAVLAAKMAYRADDHGDTVLTATPLVVTGGTNISSTTPETDLTDTDRANKGVLERNTDVDVFRFVTGNGLVRLTVQPWVSPSGSRAGNLDVSIELRAEDGTVIAADHSATTTAAELQTTLLSGAYYLFVRGSGTGTPLASPPSGYTSYGSLGQYFIGGMLTPVAASPSLVEFSTRIHEPGWGSVSPASGSYAAGTILQVTASPAPYYRFVAWTNAAVGTNTTARLTLQTNILLGAIFAELLTTNHPTPYWWLAAYGYTANFEAAAESSGANGLPVWQSFYAGLNPTAPDSQLRLSVSRDVTSGDTILRWNPVLGRRYKLWGSTNVNGPFSPLPNATDLPDSTTSFRADNPSSGAQSFYQLEVMRP